MNNIDYDNYKNNKRRKVISYLLTVSLLLQSNVNKECIVPEKYDLYEKIEEAENKKLKKLIK